MSSEPLSFKQVQTFWGVALAFAIICVLVGEFVFVQNGIAGRLDWRHWAIAGLAAWSAEGGRYIRRKLMIHASKEVREGNGLEAGRKQSAAQVLGFASAIGVVMWGLVVNRTVGSPRWFDSIFYIAGVVILIAYKPSRSAFVGA